MSPNEGSPRNLYETGEVFELRRVFAVESLGKKGVRVYDGAVEGTSPSMEFTDSRFTTEDIRPGDIVRMESKGPSMAAVVEIFREGLRIYPATEPHAANLKEHAEFLSQLRQK